MSDAPSTRYSLLVRLCQPADEQAWQEFTEIYEPLVYRLARRRGFQHADADDLCQEVFQAAAKAIDRWQQRSDRGSFRAWLFRIARNVMINAIRHRQRHPGAVGGSDLKRLLDQQPADDQESRQLIVEYERQLFQWAAEEVKKSFRHSTWQAFWQTSVEGRHANEVANELALSVGAVYIARSRVMARLREKIEEVEGRDLRS
ncbi:MAG TPA: RNA polymerase sigma factor [Pirellulales bacterium]|nr:RNA polymerase sigma factor [Pirellulales bacterium]